jgi:hypothetical protein
VGGCDSRGTLVHDANLAYTTDTASSCGLGLPPGSCEEADVEINGATDATPSVFKVYAAFCPDGSPRLKAMTFGVYYGPQPPPTPVHESTWGQIKARYR